MVFARLFRTVSEFSASKKDFVVILVLVVKTNETNKITAFNLPQFKQKRRRRNRKAICLDLKHPKATEVLVYNFNDAHFLNY